MNTLNGLPPSWEPFIWSLSGQPKLPKFNCIWAVCMQEENRLVVRDKLRGTQHEESQTLTSHVKKGKGKGIKFYNRKLKRQRWKIKSYSRTKEEEGSFTHSVLQMS